MKTSLKCWVLSSLLVASCAEFRVQTPTDFVELGDTTGYRAMDPSGVVLSVRAFDTEGAGLAFWKGAVRRQIARLGSYRLEEEKSVRSADGTPGVLLHYVRSESGQQHDYAVALFVKKDPWVVIPQERLFVVESGGPRADYERRRGDLEGTLASLDLDLAL